MTHANISLLSSITPKETPKGMRIGDCQCDGSGLLNIAVERESGAVCLHHLAMGNAILRVCPNQATRAALQMLAAARVAKGVEEVPKFDFDMLAHPNSGSLVARRIGDGEELAIVHWEEALPWIGRILEAASVASGLSIDALVFRALIDPNRSSDEPPFDADPSS